MLIWSSEHSLRILSLRQTRYGSVFAAGIGKNSEHAKVAKELIKFVKSPQATQIIEEQGLEQVKQ
ncbi:substrate-binding domain-containing protein [Acinetobacter pittii]|uniref:substrate-binding domain-containing protein n=1 Tax=Acinetobacter pittii TaxID=48296 RepID=UPI00339C5692